MKKRGWICFRRDGEPDKAESEHFNYLGSDPARYLEKCTADPITWSYPAELLILENYGKDFQLEPKDVQELLTKVFLYSGSITGQKDAYTREAILAFQRAWDLTQSGAIDMPLCRVLVYVTSERELLQLPAWVASAG
jgi:hypothetical protein